MSQPSGKQNNQTITGFETWGNQREKQLFLGGLAVALMEGLVIFGVELAANPGTAWPGQPGWCWV